MTDSPGWPKPSHERRLATPAQRVALRRRRRLEQLARADHHVPVTFALVGVQKAATSSLYRMIVRHPAIAAGPEKEMRFFQEEERDWMHPDYSEYVRPATARQVRLAGDATPEYFFWPQAMERMHRYDPGLRLIVSVRDPIERAMSQWSMERDRDPSFPDVPDAIRAFASSTLPTRIPEGMSPWQLRRTSLFTRGLYAQQLRRGFDLFGEEAWLVIDFRDISGGPARVLDRVTDHLGIDRFGEYPEPEHRNVTRRDHAGAPVTVDDVEPLVALYAEELAEFGRLSGLDLSGWSTSRVVAGRLSVADLTDSINRRLGLAG